MPSPLFTTLPPCAELLSAQVTLRVSPSGSASLASTLPVVTGVSSSVVTASSTACGGVFSRTMVVSLSVLLPVSASD